MESCRTAFVTNVRKLLEEAGSSKGSASTWKFALIARAGWSTFANSDSSEKDGFAACSLHMGSGQRVAARMETVCQAAKSFAKNRFILLYVGPVAAVDEIARCFYAIMGSESIPEFCEVGFDRAVDISEPSGLREHTDLVFVGMKSAADAALMPEILQENWLSEGMPSMSQHWCISRFYWA